MTRPASDRVLWRPSQQRAGATRLAAFSRRAAGESGRHFDDYAALHRWSLDEPEAFWRLVWDFCEVRGRPGDVVLEGGSEMPGARFFPAARLNFAENLLRRDDDGTALAFRDETGRRRDLSFAALRAEVARSAAALRAAGVTPGDRVAGLLPNLPETVIAALACASFGAVWSSCSPDFGTKGVVDRFGQIEPRVLFAADGYDYGGRHFDTLSRLPELLAALPSVEHCVVVPHTRELDLVRGALPANAGAIVHLWPEFGAPHPADSIEFAALPFDHPLYILYSSGTTGKPKCIVHGAGGTLLQHLKEHRLHVDLGREDRLFYFTTCGWMMWNWLVSGLASEASLLLYDGSPFCSPPGGGPEEAALFRFAEEERATVFGISAKFVDAVAKSGYEPGREHDLSSLRTVLSTGSPLSPEGFDFVYEKIGHDLQLASISGGTDLISCFVLGNPIGAVHRGEIQAPGLGMKVEVLGDDGRRVRGEFGELCCTAPFPSMPVCFYDDPEGRRYRAAYFERFPGVWHHGDWIRETEHGGYVITGRSDAVLNPGGVRIGTAEIYRAVEALDEVVEAIAVGQQWQNDLRIVLFVRLREGSSLDAGLSDRIRSVIRAGASPRHVPARVLSVPDIPRTRSGKITELAVRDVVHDRPIGNLEALANPEALEHFRNRQELSF